MSSISKQNQQASSVTASLQSGTVEMGAGSSGAPSRGPRRPGPNESHACTGSLPTATRWALSSLKLSHKATSLAFSQMLPEVIAESYMTCVGPHPTVTRWMLSSLKLSQKTTFWHSRRTLPEVIAESYLTCIEPHPTATCWMLLSLELSQQTTFLIFSQNVTCRYRRKLPDGIAESVFRIGMTRFLEYRRGESKYEDKKYDCVLWALNWSSCEECCRPWNYHRKLQFLAFSKNATWRYRRKLPGAIAESVSSQGVTRLLLKTGAESLNMKKKHDCVLRALKSDVDWTRLRTRPLGSGTLLYG